MPVIYLSRGYEAQVDQIDFDRFGHLNWSADVQVSTPEYEKVYAYRTPWAGKGNPREKIYLHRAIVVPPPFYIVDHRDGDGLNCRRLNLRIATHSQNSRNIWGAMGANKYRGVTASGRRWRARITRGREDGTREYLMSEFFDNQDEAARAYDAKVLELFGEFATTNFPRTDYHPVAQSRTEPDIPF